MDVTVYVCLIIGTALVVNGHSLDCEPRPCVANYDPVCGSDGNTYGNMCEFEVAAECSKNTLTKAHMGECTKENYHDSVDDCPIICTMQYDPVCGTDGKTYGNKCELTVNNCRNKANIEVAHKGEC